MTPTLSPVVQHNALAVVIYRDARNRTYSVRVRGDKFNAVLHDAEVIKAGFDSLRFGDLIACEVAGKSYLDAVKGKMVHDFVCVNVRTPSDEDFEKR